MAPAKMTISLVRHDRLSRGQAGGPGHRRGFPGCVLIPGMNNPCTNPRRSFSGVWLAVGAGVGVAVGTAIHNLAVGIAIGVALGTALGFVLRPRN